MVLKRTGIRKLFYAGLILMLALVTACGSGGNDSAQQQTGANQNQKQPDQASSGGNAQETISIATTPVGTSTNVAGNGIASVISNNSSVKVTVKPYAGPNAWGPLMDSGEIALGLGNGPELAWASKGENGYQPIKNMRLVVMGNYIEVAGAAVRKDSNIKSIADLKGKRVASDYAGAIFAKVTMEAALAANGLTWDDVKKVPVPTYNSGIEALQDNRLDAAFALTPTTPLMQEVHNSVGLAALHFLDNTPIDQLDKVPQNVLDEITKRIPGAQLTVIKANGYIAQDTIGIKYPNVLVASTHLSDDTVYQILETLWANYEQLHPVHPWLKTWTPESMFSANPIMPYHPGAIKFFKDKGLWNDQAEKAQQELLK